MVLVSKIHETQKVFQSSKLSTEFLHILKTQFCLQAHKKKVKTYCIFHPASYTTRFHKKNGQSPLKRQEKEVRLWFTFLILTWIWWRLLSVCGGWWWWRRFIFMSNRTRVAFRLCFGWVGVETVVLKCKGTFVGISRDFNLKDFYANPIFCQNQRSRSLT